jgi:rRNA maturation RNase YbeY
VEPLRLDLSLVMEADPPDDLTEAQLRELAAFVLAAEGAAGDWEIAVALVDDARLRTLHEQFMGIDTATDVMTFPNANTGAAGGGGDVVISVDHARTQAPVWGLTPADEVRFLVVHGLLHLLGWRDEIDADRQRMLARQTELFARWREVREPA